jgi:hypothetical protein
MDVAANVEGGLRPACGGALDVAQAAIKGYPGARFSEKRGMRSAQGAILQRHDDVVTLLVLPPR